MYIYGIYQYSALNLYLIHFSVSMYYKWWYMLFNSWFFFLFLFYEYCIDLWYKKNEFIQVKKKACKEYNEMHQIKKIAKVVIFMQT